MRRTSTFARVPEVAPAVKPIGRAANRHVRARTDSQSPSELDSIRSRTCEAMRPEKSLSNRQDGSKCHAIMQSRAVHTDAAVAISRRRCQQMKSTAERGAFVESLFDDRQPSLPLALSR